MKKNIYGVLILAVALLAISSTVNSQTPTPAPVVPTVTTSSPTNVTQNSATYNGNVTSSGGATVTARGFYRSTSPFMAASTTIPNGSGGTGAFSVSDSGLACNTKYYIKPYARNSAGTGVPGGTVNFTTNACPSPTPTPTPAAPSVNNTPTASGMTSTGATLNGNITDTGTANVTSRGFNYGLTTAYGTNVNQTTGAPFGTGAFSANIGSLTCGTLYNFRSYATNSVGTTNSSNRTFSTQACPSSTPSPVPTPVPPTVGATPTSSNVTMTTARLNSSISGNNLTEYGFDYGTSATSLTLNSNRAPSSSGSFTGPIFRDITNLTPNTTYYFRAYAKNAGGTTYSANTSSFTTSQNIKALNGWAWSSNIGWVSFNCANVDGTCATSDYKVQIDLMTGLLTGYAWSSNIGWIKFGGLSDPSGGSYSTPAKIDMTNGNGEGWARACAGTVNGDCSTMTSRTDGWDGWIELAGTNHSADAIPTPTPSPAGYTGVRMNTTTGSITGMAWGSNVVGWLNFNASTDITSNFIASCTATPDVASNNSFRFTASVSGSGTYEYKWDTSTSYVSTNTFDKSYTLGTKDPVGVSLTVRKVGTTQTVSPTCVGYPTSLPPHEIKTQPQCRITNPAPDASGKVSIFEDDSVSFQVQNPESRPGSITVFSYYPGLGSSVQRDTQTYTHKYASPIAAGTFYPRVVVKDTGGKYGDSASYPCGQVEVKGRGLDLKIAPDGTDAFTSELTIKKGRNVKLMWMNSLQTDPTVPGGHYDCRANPPLTTGNEWDEFASANVNNIEGTISGLSTQKTGKHIFEISCQHFPINPSLDMSERATLNVVSTSGSEI